MNHLSDTLKMRSSLEKVLDSKNILHSILKSLRGVTYKNPDYTMGDCQLDYKILTGLEE